ncbi:MAG TPA: GYF domain-containing protein, partial [Kofleriaceae bacterium]
AALEEEWYVSIDGEQAGPFSLADAQRWVAQQPLDAELHCWSEGFDDWLPVDKVSHFRGLRKRPPTPTPPPLPRAGVPPRAAAPAPALVEDEPKPLFAATMASLERGAPAMPTTGLGLPPPAPARATPPPGNAIPPRGNPGQNGAHGAAIAPLQARPEAKIDAKPEAKIDAKPEAKIDAKIDTRIETLPAASSPAALPRFPIGNPFDVSEAGDAATQLEAMPFDDAPALGREPRPSASDAGVIAPQLPASTTLRGTGAGAAVTRAANDFGSDDGDLNIGEVSRVVNLADVSRGSRTDGQPGAPRPGSVPPARATGMNPSVRPGTRPGVRSTGAVGSLGTAGAPGTDGDPAMSMAPVVRAHRRGLIVLLAVAGVVVLGVIGAVVVFVTREDDPTTGGRLGAVHDIDTSRPEDPVTHRPVGSAAVPAPAPPPPRPVPRPRPNPAITTGNPAAEAPPAGGLASDEIEDVARKHQEATQRCYMRSQRGADAILIGDVRKIAVTLTIDRDGNVSDLQLSEHAADNLGKCLSTLIKGWKFRQSAGGIYRFSLAFASG